MDAVMAPVGELPAESHSSEKSVAREKSGICLAPRIKAALVALSEALNYAQDLGTDPWEFAIEISSMRRLKLSNSDLRWVVVRGLVEHAVEVTLSDDAQRNFRHPARLLFSKKTCFVLTPAGSDWAREFREKNGSRHRAEGRSATEQPVLALVHPPKPLAPKWDRDRQELRVGSIVVKRFTIPAAGQAAILAAFEEQNWPSRIDNPLVSLAESSSCPRLQEVIDGLNRNKKQPLIRFCLDGSGNAVSWELCSDPPASSDA